MTGAKECLLTLAFASDEGTGGAWGTQWLLRHVRAVRGDACLMGVATVHLGVVLGDLGIGA